MSHPAIAHIDLEALHYNLTKIKSFAPKSNILAMVKGNAYGHGAVEITKTLESEINAFGVVYLKEALQLINAGIKKPIVIFTGFFDQEELKIINQYNLECVIHNFSQIEILENTKLTNPLRLWFKIDTGLHRLGFQIDQAQSAYQRLIKHKMVEKPLRLVTHFSEATNSNKINKEIAAFENIVANLEGEWCMANSATILALSKFQDLSHWIRPGITLYGASPFANKTGLELGLKPVMTLASRLITIHNLGKGEAVGYGGLFTCPEKMLVGTASIGYGDGYSRNLKTGTPVLVNGIRTQLIGRVAMDMIGIDLRPIPNAKIGSPVILWGRGLPVEEVSQASGEFQYELLTRLTSRVHYQYYKRSSDIKI